MWRSLVRPPLLHFPTPVTSSPPQVPVAAASASATWSLYTPRQRGTFLVVLFLVATSNFFDRHIVAALLEPIRLEFNVSDTMLGAFSGLCFAIFYAAFGVPVARWADRGNRRTIITLALTVWSVMTMLCGL